MLASDGCSRRSGVLLPRGVIVCFHARIPGGLVDELNYHVMFGI